MRVQTQYGNYRKLFNFYIIVLRRIIIQMIERLSQNTPEKSIPNKQLTQVNTNTKKEVNQQQTHQQNKSKVKAKTEDTNSSIKWNCFSATLYYSVNSIAYCFSIRQNKTTLIAWILLSYLIVSVEGMCETRYTYLNGQQNMRDSCQMCFFSFNQKTYFLKCQKKTNCSLPYFHQDSNQSQINSQLPHKHKEVCQQQSGVIYDSEECRELCCSYFTRSSPKSQINNEDDGVLTKQYCQVVEEQKRMALLFSAIFMTIPVVFCGIFVFLGCRDRQRNQRRPPTQFGNTAQSFVRQSQINLQKFQISQMGPYHLDISECCAVCLQDKCNCYTKCGHYYHPKCFREWLVKRPRCPVCMSKEYNPVKVYCLNCRIGVKLVVFAHGKIDQKQSELVSQTQNLVCSNCQNQDGKISNSIKHTVLNGFKKLEHKNTAQAEYQQQNQEHISIVEFSQEKESKQSVQKVQQLKTANQTQNYSTKQQNQLQKTQISPEKLKARQFIKEKRKRHRHRQSIKMPQIEQSPGKLLKEMKTNQIQENQQQQALEEIQFNQDQNQSKQKTSH